MDSCPSLMTTKRNLAISVAESDAPDSAKLQAERVIHTVSDYVGLCATEPDTFECDRLSSTAYLQFSGMVTAVKYQ